jgi:hypothetical protein
MSAWAGERTACGHTPGTNAPRTAHGAMRVCSPQGHVLPANEPLPATFGQPPPRRRISLGDWRSPVQIRAPRPSKSLARAGLFSSGRQAPSSRCRIARSSPSRRRTATGGSRILRLERSFPYCSERADARLRVPHLREGSCSPLDDPQSTDSARSHAQTRVDGSPE